MLTAYDIKKFALISALNADIEAMKAANMERKSKGHALAYDEKAFYEVSNHLRAIAFKIRQAKNKRAPGEIIFKNESQI